MIKKLKHYIKHCLGNYFYYYLASRYHFFKNWLPSGRIILQNRHKRVNDIAPLSRLIKPLTKEIYIDNGQFGMSYSFRKYSHYKGPIKATIEHGCFFDEPLDQDINFIFDKMIVLSDFRASMAKHLEHKIIFKIGPYIHYADNYYPENVFKQEKERLGKVLLVFPTHSTESIDVNYKVKDFIDYINSIRAHFDNVVICMFFADILRGRAKPYLEQGYEIVTAGARYDPFFLSRLKTIIKLSDHTISNSLGTHLGYCIYLNKPHYLFTQESEYSSSSIIDVNHIDISHFPSNNQLAVAEVTQAFTKWEDTITPLQHQIITKYWGTNHIKSPKELKEILTAR